LTSKVDETVVPTRTEPAKDSAEHARTRKIVERKAWATVASIAVCADDNVSSRAGWRYR
jgi:hypothetical protein